MNVLNNYSDKVKFVLMRYIRVLWLASLDDETFIIFMMMILTADDDQDESGDYWVTVRCGCC